MKAHSPTKTNIVPFAVAQGFVYFVYGDGAKGSGDRPATLTIYDQGKDKAVLPYFAAHTVQSITANGKLALHNPRPGSGPGRR
ncbi:hypothetical protein [Streptomyces sp. URMC 125]|uniref:hypothetical protein n=1 Tax=Streptomyces sp. URMC 125 TaxID=3423419 RepID=UPI003F1D643F